MLAKDTPLSEERAVETGQHSEPAQHTARTKTVGYFEPHQLTKLAQNGRLYVVADSVGGAASGQVASQYAVKKILHAYYNDDNPNLEARLRHAIQQANIDIFDRNREHPTRRLMATTVMAALIHDNKLLVANVGDSRVYVVWDQDIEWLNSSLPKQKDDDKEEGHKSPPLIPATTTPAAEKSAAPLPLPRPLPEALGVEKEVKIETFTRRLFAGDIVVLCSGGIAGYVTEKEVANAMTKHAPDQAIRRLLVLAAERGNRSHIAFNVTRVLSSPVAMRTPLPMVMPAPPSWSDWETAPRPGQPGSDKPATRPMSIPVPPSPPVTGSLAKPNQVEIPLNPAPRWRWQGCLMIAVVVLLLCGLSVAALRFLVPADIQAAIPFFQDLETLMAQATQESDEATLATAESETEASGSSSAGQTQLTTPISTQAAVAPPNPATTGITESSSPIPTPTLAAPAAVTDTITINTPLATPSPAPTIALPANCENKARFVTDVTVEDGEQFGPNANFAKVWRLRNEGTCPWGPGYTVRFLEGDYFGVTEQILLVETTNPDEDGDLSVPMIAPTAAGQYRGVWQMYDLTGEPFGPTMYLEIEVVPGVTNPVDSGSTAGTQTLYDFIARAADATWSSGQVTYPLQPATISEELELPESGGLVATGSTILRGNEQSQGSVLLTYPHQDLGFIEGTYPVDVPLQPGDTLAATLGFPKLSILSDDGVTFEVNFIPTDGNQVIIVFSETVQYRDSPITQTFPLTGIQAGQTGTFTLRVLSGDSTNSDWAVWIDLRLVRS